MFLTVRSLASLPIVDNNGCCFDYGNAEKAGGGLNSGNMEAIYFGSGDKAPDPSGRLPNCSTGAYVMPDMENMYVPPYSVRVVLYARTLASPPAGIGTTLVVSRCARRRGMVTPFFL